MTTHTTIHLEDWPVAPAEPAPGSLVVWRKRLAEARERGGFTEEDQLNISAFQTCAVGEFLGFPKSDIWMRMNAYPGTEQLGYAAAKVVLRNNFDAFAAILDQLEAMKRSEQ